MNGGRGGKVCVCHLWSAYWCLVSILQSALITDDKAAEFRRQVYLPIKLTEVAQYVLIALGSLFLIEAIVLLLPPNKIMKMCCDSKVSNSLLTSWLFYYTDVLELLVACVKGAQAPRSGIDELERMAWNWGEELACSCLILPRVLRCCVLYGVDFCFKQSMRCVANRARIWLRSLRVPQTFVSGFV